MPKTDQKKCQKKSPCTSISSHSLLKFPQGRQHAPEYDDVKQTYSLLLKQMQELRNNKVKNYTHCRRRMKNQLLQDKDCRDFT